MMVLLATQDLLASLEFLEIMELVKMDLQGRLLVDDTPYTD